MDDLRTDTTMFGGTQEGLVDQFKVAGQRAVESSDPEQRIGGAKQALEIEPQITAWPYGFPREKVRGNLWRSLGSSYESRRLGSRAENLDQAIIAYNQALISFSGDVQDWATTQNDLGNAYAKRITGDRADNLEHAIASFESALTVPAPDNSPRTGMVYSNLAGTYADRLRGDRAENTERALRYYGSALGILTREAFPREWAAVQNNLGIIYRTRERGNEADNVERAIVAHSAALSYFSREAQPEDWAEAQSNLGVAYVKRTEGGRSENCERAISAFESALTVVTKATFPENWALITSNLASAYSDRISGARAENLKRAISLYELALTVLTLETFPRDNLATNRKLGDVLFEMCDWGPAMRVLLAARSAFILLFGQGLDENEARDLIQSVGNVFQAAAYAASELGDLDAALSLLNEGKARLLLVDLRLLYVDFTAEKRKTLETLRADIRKADQELDFTRGIERSNALEKLGALRRELIALVEAAAPASSGLARFSHTTMPRNFVIVAPVITKIGSKVLILNWGAEGPVLTALPLGNLTTRNVEQLLVGPENRTELRGWLGAYNIQHLPPREFSIHREEWLGAIERLGTDLWTLIAGSIHDELVRRNIEPDTRIVWLPTGDLGLLPIGIAQDEAGRRFGEIYQVGYTPSLDAIMAITDVQGSISPSLTAVVNPTGDLQFTEIEGQLVASHFTPAARTVISHEAATREAVLAALKDKTYWHFATHGTFVWRDSRQSALLMRGGAPLTVTDLFDAQNLGRPHLVVLSACETGLYDAIYAPEEFVGMPSAFISLGAAGVVATLWLVDDRATALLVSRFYDFHLTDGLTPVASLKRAQAWLKNATTSELLAYARSAAANHKIQEALGRDLEASLTRGSYHDSGHSGNCEWFENEAKAVNPIGEKSLSVTSPGFQNAPFSHPYYWGAFTYTGA